MKEQGKGSLDVNGKPYNKTAFVIILLAGAFVTMLNSTLLATAFPSLMKAFSVSADTVQWLTTGFMLVTGIFIPVSAWLSEQVNTKWLFLGAMFIFEIGSVLAFCANSFSLLLIGRLVQAIGVGVVLPLLQTILLVIFPADKRGEAMGLAGIVVGLAPAIGPTLSGWIIDNYSWRMLFGIIIPITALVLLFGLFYIKPVLSKNKKKLDFISLILSTIGFGVGLYGFSSVGQDGWLSFKVIVSLIIGALGVFCFFERQTHLTNPFLNVQVFKSTAFTVSTLVVSLVYMAMFGASIVLPLYLQIAKGDSALTSGLTLLPGALLMGVLSPIAGEMFDRYGAKKLSISGIFILLIGTLPFAFLTKDTPELYIVVMYTVRMFGIALAMMPLTTYGMNSLPVNLIAHGTAVNNTIRQVAGSAAIAIMVSVMSNVTKNGLPAKRMRYSNPLKYRNLAINANLKGYSAAFLVAVVITLIAFIISFTLKKGKMTVTVTKQGLDEGGKK